MWTFFLGFGIGLLVCAVASRVLLQRHLRIVRAAERRARAAERLAEIGGLTGGLAHEIKNPLSTLGLNAQLVAEGLDELSIDPEAKARLGNRVRAVRREADRLRGILADFLEFAGEVRLAPQEADLNALVEEMAEFYGPEAQRQNVRVRSDPAPQAVRAMVDVKLIKQALLNLVLNATQAMSSAPAGHAPPPVAGGSGSGTGPGGELILRVRQGQDEQRRPIARVHVIDTGPGIAADVLAKIFNPYFTTKAGGTGLGLSTARRLIEAHGGRLDVHSEVGRGTDFTITLPLTPAPTTLST